VLKKQTQYSLFLSAGITKDNITFCYIVIAIRYKDAYDVFARDKSAIKKRSGTLKIWG